MVAIDVRAWQEQFVSKRRGQLVRAQGEGEDEDEPPSTPWKR